MLEVALAPRTEPDLVVEMLELRMCRRCRGPSGFSGTLGVPRRRTLGRRADERPDTEHGYEQDRGGDESDRHRPVGLVHQELDQHDAGDEGNDEQESGSESRPTARLMR